MTRRGSPPLFALIALGVSLGSAPPSAAHHSAAMYDGGKSVAVAGTVRDFQWANPHCFIQLVEATPSGPVEWSVEMAAPLELVRLGWKKTTVQAGEKLTIVMHPLRDGGRGGRFVSAAGADGPVGPRT